jgi:hypothetical protein
VDRARSGRNLGAAALSYLPLLIFAHILLMVFWVGTDIGVFAAALRYIDHRRPLLERAACMSLGIVIDRFPRVCFVAILPLGLTIAALIGFLPLSAGVLAIIWILSAIWMTAVIQLMRLAGKPQARPWHLLERVFLVTYMVVFIGLGIAGLVGRLPVPGWLAGKLICYGAICLFGLSLDHSFGAVLGAFGEIEARGSTPEREALLKNRMYRSLAWVLAIYAGVLMAGFLGTVKP